MIRPATPADRKLVKELRAEFEREVPDELWDDDDEDYEWTYVLLAGDAGLAALDRKDDRFWFLDLLYVRPAARGKGLGRELLAAAAEYVQQQGAEMLALDVLESNADARRLYDRLGFRTIERTLAAPVASLVGGGEDGPTFGFVHVQTDDVDKVTRDATKFLRVEPDVEAGSGWIRVRSDATDAEPERLKALAKELSYTAPGVTLALGIERGTVVRYNLFDRGADVDEYLSVPEFYGALPPGDVYALGANPTVVARLTGADARKVREVARTAGSPAELPPAEELYEQLAAVMKVKP
ncbi:MAG TPA: GNAT family N-acetyltransferase [Gaiellaceae bacterium]|nr:GNAT family N-acetyltransferase [Gaiellaceae bacterium]